MSKTHFKGKFRIKTARYSNWDYSQGGWYFVTICTKGFKKYFGKIENDKVKLNKIGKIADEYLIKIPDHYPNTRIDEYIVMPNHVHIILVIEKNAKSLLSTVETCHGKSLHMERKFSKPIPGSLSTIINQYKGSVKRYCNKNNLSFSWQPRYFDHIIRSENSYFEIKQYIKDNPKNWNLDCYFKILPKPNQKV